VLQRAITQKPFILRSDVEFCTNRTQRFTQGFLGKIEHSATIPNATQRMKMVRRAQRSLSNVIFTDCQPQYPNFQADFNADFIRVQEVFSLPAHHRR
jgi:hypothetical protein